MYFREEHVRKREREQTSLAIKDGKAGAAKCTKSLLQLLLFTTCAVAFVAFVAAAAAAALLIVAVSTPFCLHTFLWIYLYPNLQPHSISFSNIDLPIPTYSILFIHHLSNHPI